MNLPQSIHFAITEAVRFVSPVGLAIEWVLLAFCVTCILLLPSALSPRLARLGKALASLAAKPGLAMATCLILPILLRLLLLPVSPVPVPSIHDEFSHLLLGDTLAHGRLTNPTPVMWRHFETIHVIQRPTYNSMYQPGEGIFLALGQVVFGQPWAGVLLSIALMFAAMYWMFLAWLPRNWALYGVLLAILKLALVGFWVDSYMGGSVPAIGGALVVGCLPRLQGAAAGKLHSLLFGLGAVILMNTRPFEGGVLTFIVLAFLFPVLYRRYRESPGYLVKSLLLPGAAVLLLGVAALGFYCFRVTGHSARLPYQVNRSTYGWPENLAILKPKQVKLQDPVLRNMYELEVSHHSIYASAPALLDNLTTRVFDNWAYLLGPLLTLPFLLPILTWQPQARRLILILCAMGALNLLQLLLYPYHLAPIIPAIFCLVALGTQQIFGYLARLGQGRARYWAVLLPLFLLIVCGLKLFSDEIDIPPSSYWERGFEWQRDTRAAVLTWLDSRPGKHLVIVRYAVDHPVNQEWVYNGADIEGSKVLWARELDPEANRKLIRFYNDRHLWLLEADVYPQRVVPYRPRETASKSTCVLCSSTSTNDSGVN